MNRYTQLRHERYLFLLDLLDATITELQEFYPAKLQHDPELHEILNVALRATIST